MSVKHSGWKQVLGAGLVTLIVWIIFSWPLIRHLTSAIVYVPDRPDGAAQFDYFHACDPLQLIYHFWLAGDMVGGGTPAFHNVYEFNTGDDAARYVPGTYYAPFSLLYALGEWMAGRAFGLNWIGILGLWGTLVFSYALVRRYTPSNGWAMASALVSVFLPYRWFALFGGSPAGLAMTWVPLVLLGLDMAVRDRRILGGWLAGLGIFLCCMGDSHVFFFTVLFCPIWCLFVLLHAAVPLREIPRRFWSWTCSLAPFALLLLGAYLLNHHLSLEVAGGGSVQGRSDHEVRLCSPSWRGLFFHHFLALDNQIYLGWVLPICLAASLLVALVLYVWRRDGRSSMIPLLSLGLILGATVLISILALGLNGPANDTIYGNARKWIPFFSLIRQPTKIMVIMPTLLCVALALAGSVLSARLTNRLLLRFMALLLVLAMLGEYKWRISPGLFVLPKEQGAYAAVAADAAARDVVSRALVVVFWPGDSHETTVFEYFASLYRIRLVNGYRPFVDPEYRAFFDIFSSVNQGALSDEQADDLLDRGIDYVILHEDRFPEKVSPFPVTFTLRRLLESPRLVCLGRHDEVWAFRILPQPEKRDPVHADWTLYSAADRLEAERHSQGCDVVTDPAASYGRYLVLGEGDAIQFDPSDVGPEPQTRWLVRVRGTGEVSSLCWQNKIPMEPVRLSISHDEWTWIDVPLPDRRDYGTFQLELKGGSGSVHVDQAILTAGDWNWTPAIGEKVWLPAAGFFHAGHIDLDHNTVVFEKGRRTGPLFGGPNLPLTEGKYRLTLRTRSDAPAGTDLGQLRISSGSKEMAIESIPAGEDMTLEWKQTTDLSFSLVFIYSGRATMEIDGALLERVQ